MKKHALEGVRVADFSWAWAGAHIGTLLALLGADVIKIESRGQYDGARMFSLTTGQYFSEPDHSPVFNDINLNKMSVNLDLKQPKGVELANELVKISDIVTQNMRPGVMDRLGLGYEALKEVKPDIIVLSSSSQGATGPERSYIGYAPSFAALSGLAYITGYPDGPPVALPGEIDLMSATTSAFAVLAALNYRQRTGEGQHIDLSSSEATSVFLGEVLMDYAMNGRIPSRRGNQDEFMAPHNCYRCKGDDNWVSIAIANDQEWRAFCEATGSPDWVKDERFSDTYNRWQNQEELDRLVESWTVNFTHYEVMGILQSVGVAAIPSFNSEELFNDPHLRARHFWAEVDHPVIGKQTVVAPQWKLSRTPAQVRCHGPLMGEHNQHVFGELLGIPLSEIKRLIEERVIY